MTTKLALLSIEQLVAEFATIGIAQDEALLEGSTRKFNRLYDSKIAVLNELKSRGDARRELVKLYDHQNMQVRLNAANATLAVAPKEARQVLEVVRASQCYPQAMDAGMCIRGLDDGTYLPA